MIRALSLVFLLLALISLTCSGCSSSDDESTLHVSPAGDDAADGSADAPWKTLQHAANQLVPGDILQLEGGIYSGPLIISTSGTAEQPITIRSAPEANAVIDGTDWDVGRGFSALIQIRSISHLRIEGLEIRNAVSTLGRRNPVGIFVSGSGTDIELRNNNIHSIEAIATSGQRDGHGIAVYGTAEEPLSNITIAGNEVHDLILGTSESVVINGNVDGFIVEDNHVHHNDNIGIDVIGFEGTAPSPELDRARNGVVRNNLVHHIDTALNTAYQERNAGGIYVDGGADILIEDNIVHSSNFGIEIASEDGNGDTSRVTVKNNVVFANHLAGLALGGYDENRGRTQNCEVTGNTFVGNDTDRTGTGDVLIQYNVVDNTIVNNVFVTATGSFIVNQWVENEGSLVDNNAYSTIRSDGSSLSTQFWQWRNELYGDFDSYRDASGNDANSVFADVQLRDVSAFDFSIAEDSPARTTGTDDGVPGASNEMLTRAFEAMG